jgi:hypothetical protein
VTESETPPRTAPLQQERLSNSELVTAFPGADPDFDLMSANELEAFIAESDNTIAFGRDHGAEEIFLIGLQQQRRRAEAQLARRNGRPDLSPFPIPYLWGRPEKRKALRDCP